MVAATRLVSAGSLVATLTLPSVALVAGASRAVTVGAAATAALIIWRHRGNIQRLWRGHRAAIAAIAGRTPVRNVAVLGAGSWGTALAVHLARIGHTGAAVGPRSGPGRRDAERGAPTPSISPTRRSPTSLSVTDRLDEALAGAAMVVVTVPSHGLRAVARQAAAHVDADAVVLSATKGLEDGSLLRMSEVLAEEWPHVRDVAVLSGPSFAAELARSLPTVVVVASRSADAVRPRAGGVPLGRDASLCQPATSSASSSAAP